MERIGREHLLDLHPSHPTRQLADALSAKRRDIDAPDFFEQSPHLLPIPVSDQADALDHPGRHQMFQRFSESRLKRSVREDHAEWPPPRLSNHLAVKFRVQGNAKNLLSQSTGQTQHLSPVKISRDQ